MTGELRRALTSKGKLTELQNRFREVLRMTSTKLQYCAGLLLGGITFLFSTSGAVVAADIKFKVTAKPTTCDLSVQPTYDLKELPLGVKDNYPDFPIEITCPASMKTAIIAKNLSGVLNKDGQQVTISMPNAGTDNGPFFWLKANGSRIFLRGLETEKFCESLGQSSLCNIAPGTLVNYNSPWGAGTVKIRFTVVYPA